jgi:hypothetical protein
MFGAAGQADRASTKQPAAHRCGRVSSVRNHFDKCTMPDRTSQAEFEFVFHRRSSGPDELTGPAGACHRAGRRPDPVGRPESDIPDATDRSAQPGCRRAHPGYKGSLDCFRLRSSSFGRTQPPQARLAMTELMFPPTHDTKVTARREPCPSLTDRDRILRCGEISRCANFCLPHALPATLLRRVVPAPQRSATHLLRP